MFRLLAFFHYNSVETNYGERAIACVSDRFPAGSECDSSGACFSAFLPSVAAVVVFVPPSPYLLASLWAYMCVGLMVAALRVTRTAIKTHTRTHLHSRLLVVETSHPSPPQVFLQVLCLRLQSNRSSRQSSGTHLRLARC